MAKLTPMLIAGAVIAFLIYYFVKGIYFMIGHKKQIDANWPTYRCKPYVLPFAGWFVGPGTTNPANNFVECSFSVHKSYYDVLKQDFVTMFGSLSDIVKDQQEAIQDVRNMTNFMRNSIKNMAEDVYQKMYDAYYRISALFGVFMGSFGKLFDLFKETFNVLLYGYYTLQSIWNGPIGGTTRALYDIATPIRDVVRFFCFDPETPILMADGSYVRARNVRLGEHLGLDSGIVTACMEIEGKNAEMYLYKDCVTVSGTHLVYSESEKRWIRVENSIDSQPAKWDGRNIICFNTTSNRIPAGGMLFSDYMETNDKKLLSRMQGAVLHRLNTGEPISPSSHDLDYLIPRKQYQWALDGRTMIDMYSGPSKQIKDLKIGDRVALGGFVRAVIKVASDEVELYKYSGSVMSGSQIVLYNSSWIELRDIPSAHPIKGTKEPLYHVACDFGKLILRNGVIITDYQQIDCDDTCDFEDEYVQKQCYQEREISS